MPGKSQRSHGGGEIMPGKSQRSSDGGKIMPGKSQRSSHGGEIMPGKSQRSRGGKAEMESNTSIASIMKDIGILGSSRMTWKEKKELENRKVVSLGGKPPKKQRLPLSVAKVPMKRQKAREQRMLQENAILRRFGAKFSSSSNLERMEEKHKPERRVLKSTEGVFKNGVLDVKHLLRPDPVVGNSQDARRSYQGKGKKKVSKKNQQKKGHKNRH